MNARQNKPSRYKMALLTWAIVYPLITLLLAILDPLVGELAMPIRTLILSAIMVPAMVYFAMPRAIAIAHGWLYGSSPHS